VFHWPSLMQSSGACLEASSRFRMRSNLQALKATSLDDDSESVLDKVLGAPQGLRIRAETVGQPQGLFSQTEKESAHTADEALEKIFELALETSHPELRKWKRTVRMARETVVRWPSVPARQQLDTSVEEARLQGKCHVTSVDVCAQIPVPMEQMNAREPPPLPPTPPHSCHGRRGR